MDVLVWARSARVGESHVYYVGAIDTFRTPREKESFWTAQRASDEGLVFLSQKRMDPDKVAYRVTRVSKKTLDVLAKISSCPDSDSRRRNVFANRTHGSTRLSMS